MRAAIGPTVLLPRHQANTARDGFIARWELDFGADSGSAALGDAAGWRKR